MKFATTLFAGLIAMSSSCCTVPHPLAPLPLTQNSLEKILQGAYCVRVESQGMDGVVHLSYGTALAISYKENQTILTTSAHVVQEPGRIILSYSLVDNRHDEEKKDDVPFRVLSLDEDADTAILLASHKIPIATSYEIKPSLEVHAGDRAYIIGFPFGLGKWPSQAMVSEVYNDKIILDGTVNFGNSGGLAFYQNNDGKYFLLGQIKGCMVGDSPIAGCKGYALVVPIKILLQSWGDYIHDERTTSDRT